MGTTSNFDITQTAFLFNLIANSSSAGNATGMPNGSQALADITWGAVNGTANLNSNPFPALNYVGLIPTYGSQLYGGSWELVWGPGVYQINTTYGLADNTAFVVQCKAKNLYIVAVAGTDPAAFQDWLLEDLQVGPDYCVDWEAYVSGNVATGSATPTASGWHPAKQQISLGTALGVWALASQLTQSSQSPSIGTTLASFLQSIASQSGQTIIFTGHSLGGALSPTLANWVHAQSTKPKATILTMPTAGPTPGNGLYQIAWDANFPQMPVTQSGYPTVNGGNLVSNFNNDVWNEDDVVPHAWERIYGTTSETYNSNDLQYLVSASGGLFCPLSQITAGDDADALASAAALAQAAGIGALMARSAHTTSFPTVWPLSCINNGQLSQLLQPPAAPATMAVDPTLTTYLGGIHVWGYGSDAFGIDFSIFDMLHPTPTPIPA